MKLAKIILRSLIGFLLPLLALFLAAGRLDWWQAWFYVILSLSLSLLSRVLLARIHPELIRERTTALDMDDAKKWDKLLVRLVAFLGPLLILLAAGLEHRFGSLVDFPLWAEIAAIAVILVGYGFGIWALFANRFFSAVVRIQSERGHVVVDSGPYRIVRHPAYASSLWVNLAIPLLLDSVWALIPAVLVNILLVVRTILEDRTLQAELPGYADYARRVRWRLLPGIF